MSEHADNGDLLGLQQISNERRTAAEQLAAKARQEEFSEWLSRANEQATYELLEQRYGQQDASTDPNDGRYALWQRTLNYLADATDLSYGFGAGSGDAVHPGSRAFSQDGIVYKASIMGDFRPDLPFQSGQVWRRIRSQRALGTYTLPESFDVQAVSSNFQSSYWQSDGVDRRMLALSATSEESMEALLAENYITHEIADLTPTDKRNLLGRMAFVKIGYFPSGSPDQEREVRIPRPDMPVVTGMQEACAAYYQPKMEFFSSLNAPAPSGRLGKWLASKRPSVTRQVTEALHDSPDDLWLPHADQIAVNFTSAAGQLVLGHIAQLADRSLWSPLEAAIAKNTQRGNAILDLLDIQDAA